MGIKSALLRPFSQYVARRIDRMSSNAVACQEKIFQEIIKTAKKTAFGQEHHFENIQSHEDFVKNVPIRDYEGLKTYIERLKTGESNVLWPGKPRYFAKTSGTTSGVKYIPITRESTSNHFGTARDTMFNYAARTGNFAWLDGFLIFLSGSPELDSIAGIPTGRLSGISNHLVPAWLRRNQMPGWETNCIEDWEEKLEKIVSETLPKDMRMISGIPPWVLMYYERLLAVTGKKTIREIFPNYSVFAFGGVNFEPYRAKLEALVGGKIDSVEMFPASEGFIAFQDSFPSKGLLLNANSGIFFEFIPLDEISKPYPTRLTLKDVQKGVNYVLILSSNAGLWGYNIGDTVIFVSTNPYRLIVSGRVKHYISAFGEHVIGKEVEEAMQTVADRENVRISEFHVAPQVNPPEGGAAYHEWFVEFDTVPVDLEYFAKALDNEMMLQNIYYDDLIKGQILQPLKIRPLKPNSFRDYMKSEGKLGGQNKVPRLANDRKIADFFEV
jgi:hypothetical protein